MREGWIAFQILRLSGAIGVTFMDESQAGYELAVQINDELKRAVYQHPTSFAALAELPMHVPEPAIKELHRCVKESGFVSAMMHGSIGASGNILMVWGMTRSLLRSKNWMFRCICTRE